MPPTISVCRSTYVVTTTTDPDVGEPPSTRVLSDACQFEPPVVTDPPDVIADPIPIEIGPVRALARDLLAHLDGFEHRAVAEPAATDVVHLADARRLHELVEGPDEVATVYCIAYLLSFVPVNAVLLPR